MMELINTKNTVRKSLDTLDLGGGVDNFLLFAANNSTLLPQWWTEIREKSLRKASIENDLLSSVIQILVMKLYTLPVKVVPKNPQVTASVQLADTYNTLVQGSWNRWIELFVNDLMVYDKGAFLLIEGNENISEPLQQGQIPTGFRHIPSEQIFLRNDIEFPYRWQLNSQRNIKIHDSRIIRLTQMPVAISEHSHVGLSFVSRAFNVASLMTSSIQYGLEGLGKIESDQIIYATSVTSKTIQQAFKEARIDSLNQGLKSNGDRVYLGLRDPAAKVGVLDLKRLPANFNYETFLRVSVKLLSIAAGVDEDDIAATSSAGTTKTATLISDLKSRFKLVAWFTDKITREFQQKFLPQSLTIQIGDTSGEINESEAKTRINIARTDKILFETEVLSLREGRKNAVRHGFITEDQFEELELKDGRLPNGLPIHTLFFTQNEMVQSMISIGVSDPCNVDELKLERALERARTKLCAAETIATNTTSNNIFKSAQQVVAALNWFIETYDTPLEQYAPENIPDEPQEELEGSTEETNEEENTLQKYNKPKTVLGRERQKAIRKKLREVWSNKNNKASLDSNELLNDVDETLKEELEEKIEEIDDIITFTLENTQSNGGRLNEIYDRLDNVIVWE